MEVSGLVLGEGRVNGGVGLVSAGRHPLEDLP